MLLYILKLASFKRFCNRTLCTWLELRVISGMQQGSVLILYSQLHSGKEIKFCKCYGGFSPMNTKNQCTICNTYLVSFRDTIIVLSSSLLRLSFLFANLKDDPLSISYFMTLIEPEQKIKSKKDVIVKALLFFNFSLVFLLQTTRCQKAFARHDEQTSHLHFYKE